MRIVKNFVAKPYNKKRSKPKEKQKIRVKVMKTLNQDTTCNCILQIVQLEVEPASKLFINDLDYTTQLITSRMLEQALKTTSARCGN
jgi:hypothetical protein